MTPEYPYTRTTGPVTGASLTGARDGRILANRCGIRVLRPPFDPDTPEPLAGATEMVAVGPGAARYLAVWIVSSEPDPWFR